MLITSEEFIKQAKQKGISSLQLAYLIRVKVISTPLQIKKNSGVTELLFDEIQIVELNKVLSEQINKSPSTIIKQRFNQGIVSLLEQARGMSPKVENIFAYEKGQDEHKALNQYRFNINDIENWLNAFGKNVDNNKISLLTKLKQRLPRLHYPWGIKFSLNDMIRLNGLIINLSNQINEYFFFRVRQIDEKKPKDLCLREYAKSFNKINWGMLESEIELIYKFIEHEQFLESWPLKKSLAFIQSIEIEYQTTIKVAEQYRQHIDPNNTIANHIAYIHLRQFIFDPAIKRTQEKTEKRQKEIETATKKMLEKALTSLLPIT